MKFEGIGKSEDMARVTPFGWHSRGNTPFWDEINKRIKGKDIENKEELIKFIKGVHKDLTGEELTEDSKAKCAEFAKEYDKKWTIIAGSFWYEQAFDWLAERYNLK